ncbi:MAG: serine dehydratase beta chain, partial [Pseudomonadota bacterium]
MTTSLFELFKIGIGPSSSHTVGPMLAAWRFVQNLEANALLERTVSVKVEIYGSLALTGHGHATDKALCLGLMGHLPSKINPDIIPQLLEKMRLQKKLLLFAHHEIEFDEQTDLIFKFGEFLEQHPNALIFKAFDCNHAQLFEKTYYSIGGGFVMDQDEMDQGEVFASSNQSFAYPFNNAKELLQLCETHQMTIAQIMFENEKSLRHESEIIKEIDLIITAMESSIERGLSTDGV